MKLSVIIVNYNVRAFLENALVSAGKALAGIDGEIIVADNASDDGSVEMVRQKFPAVTLIANDRNLGFAAANNEAIRASRGEYMLLLNPDTIVQEDTFSVMVRFLDEHPEAGLAGCKILNPDGSLELACRRGFPTPWVAFTKIAGLSALFPRSPLFARYNLTFLDEHEVHEVDALSGSFMMVRRAAIDQAGALDETFFMYGEDLDWCYRIKRAGWKVYYTPATQIVHYKGQSTRRSDLDEVRLFYEAMRIFVRKHFRKGFLVPLLLSAGIALREWIAFIGRIARPLRAAVIDLLVIDASLLLGELIWFGELFRFPPYAYPVTLTVPWLVIAATMAVTGVYTTRRLSVSRTAAAVLIGYVILSALTFFFKQYGFSRMVVLISGLLNLVTLPGWRLASRLVLRSPENRRSGIFGRRTIIVGTQQPGQELLRKLRSRVGDGYDVVGFVEVNRQRVGEKINGVEILGSIDNIGKVIQEQKASEVIFSADSLSYADILSVIGRSRSRSVNYRLVPTSLEVIIGKTHIDRLDDIPLVEIEYNIGRLSHRSAKRVVDFAVSAILLILVYPFVRLRRSANGSAGPIGRAVLLLPRVFSGEMSLVGPPAMPPMNGSVASPQFLGKPGLTGLVQIRPRDEMSGEEIEKLNLYYAKNQSFMLDVEILLKSLSILVRS